MEEIKEMLKSIINMAIVNNNVENDKGDTMDEKEKVDNEKVDKRKLIDEIGGILKGKVDEELWRTIIGKAEKIAYDKSEAGTSDNKKVKNESDDDKKVDNESDEDKKEVKEIKEEVEKDVDNKCKNGVNNAKTNFFDKLNEVYNASMNPPKETMYVSREDKLKAGEEYFA